MASVPRLTHHCLHCETPFTPHEDPFLPGQSCEYCPKCDAMHTIYR